MFSEPFGQLRRFRGRLEDLDGRMAIVEAGATHEVRLVAQLGLRYRAPLLMTNEGKEVARVGDTVSFAGSLDDGIAVAQRELSVEK